MTTTIRHMMKVDFATAVEIERQSSLVTFVVPGVGECTALPPWAWREQDYLDAIRSYRSRNRGTFDSRALVGSSTVRVRDEENRTDVDIQIVVGSMVYEIQQEGFEILRMSAVPGDDATRQAFVDHLLEACMKSTKRHYVRCFISDGDWENLRFFVRLGWDRRLMPSFCPDGRDAWRVETQVTESGRPPRRDLAAGA